MPSTARLLAGGGSGLAVGALLALGCGSGEEAPAVHVEPAAAWFVDVAAAAGVDFVHHSGHDGERYMLPESASGGGALFDMDGDGDLDIYLVQAAAPVPGSGQAEGNRLYRNVTGERGTGWRFQQVSQGAVADRGYGMGVATGDYDRDGDPDLYVTNVGPNLLLRNDRLADGTVRFTDVTEESGVGDPGFGASAAFVDYDRDGDLDLYVTNYVVWSERLERECRNLLGEPDYCDPLEYDAPAPDVLYRNEGRGEDGRVRFTDVSRVTGIEQAPGNSLGVVAADFDGDGGPEIFVSNDRMPDQLWVHRGASSSESRFSQEGDLTGCAVDDDGVAKAGMGVDAGDLDDDGDLDLLVGNFSAESDSLYRNEGTFFVDATADFGLRTVSRPFTRFGLGFLDFDNDGLLDLYQATGRVSRQERRFGSDPYAEPNLLFRGLPAAAGGRRFEEVIPRGGTSAPLFATGRAAAFGDIDNDGGVDILVVNRDGPVHLLRNIHPVRGHWVGFRVLDEGGVSALGAVVEAQLGERRITRSVRSAHSYLAASDPRLHLGLGEATAVDGVTVRWPDGSVEGFGSLDAGRVWTLRRGRGSPRTAGSASR